MKELVKKYIEKNRSNLHLLITIYVIGIIFGFILFFIINSSGNMKIISELEKTLSMTNEVNFSGVNILKNGLSTNSIFLSILILSSFTLVTLPIIAFIILIKGISLSMYICVIFKLFGILRGIIAIIGMAIIPSVIITLAYIFLGNECYISNEKLLIRINKNALLKSIISNVSKAAATIPFIILAIYLEQIFFRIVISV